jgi:cob(I)alamin adenosyltransferase
VSIATKRGDDGSTGLMYDRRVSKTHARVDAYGFVDELNAALGVIRSQDADEFVQETINRIQDQLVLLMGELATDPEDRERYQKDGFTLVEESFLEPIDSLVIGLEARNLSFKGWAKPGDNPISASFDVARCVCRRAERQVCHLIETEEEPNRQIMRYLNRLSDALWLCARWVETGRPSSVETK